MTRVAIVTGAGRGIGLRLASDGLAVAVNDVDRDNAEAVAAEVTAAGGRAAALPADVTNRDAVFGLVADTVAEFGRLDVLVANAGIAQVKTLLDVRPEGLERIFAVNLFGVVYSIQAAAEQYIAHSELITLGRVQQPADVAALLSYLAGPDSDYMTGQSVVIDGGIVMR